MRKKKRPYNMATRNWKSSLRKYRLKKNAK